MPTENRTHPRKDFIRFTGSAFAASPLAGSLLPCFFLTGFLASVFAVGTAFATQDSASNPPKISVPTAATVHPLAAAEWLDLSGLLGTSVASEIVLPSGFHLNPLSAAVFDLVQYMRNNVDTRTPEEVLAAIPKYRRIEMFGTWVNETAPADCYNTRAEVLLRDAVPGSAIAFSPTNPCQVARGEWSDPYSGADFKLASAVQIDHVVPLKNAYRSGAYAWSNEQRCHFANFLGDPKHLMAVSGRENMSKGDSGPERYLPPNSAYLCSYLSNWVRIKAVWNLSFSQDEQHAVAVSLQNNNCSIQSTQITLPEIQRSRAMTMALNSKCSSLSTSQTF